MSRTHGGPSGTRGPNDDGAAEPDAAMREARAVVDGIAEDVRQGRIVRDGGPAIERLRGLAFRVMFVDPLRRAAARWRVAFCKRAASRVADEPPPLPHRTADGS